jgi:hypothetical protein
MDVTKKYIVFYEDPECTKKIDMSYDKNEIVDAGSQGKPKTVYAMNILRFPLINIEFFTEPRDPDFEISPSLIARLEPFEVVPVALTWKPKKSRTIPLAVTVKVKARILRFPE